MRASVLVVLLLLARSVAAQPVQYKLDGAVLLGKRPAIQVHALVNVTDVRIELDRDDGKHFTSKQGAIAKGQTASLSIGDGAAGKASYKGTIAVKAGGTAWSDPLTFETLVAAPLAVAYDADHLNLDKHVLQFRPTRAASDATLIATGDDGAELGKGSETYATAPKDGWYAISWTQPKDARVMTLKLRVATSDGAATNVELVPWSVTIDHEDVNFSTDSAVIEPSETQKLDASLAKIQEVAQRAGRFMKMRLYIAGHTDTVGPSAKNRKLSMDRALSIGQYLRKKGVAIPIAVAGFGEEVLKVKTGDNVDERANRRADYVIGPAVGTPPFKGPYLKIKTAWKTLP